MREIVITGLGVICALGMDPETFWQSCRQARSGIAPIETRLEGCFKSPLAALVDDYDPRRELQPAVYRRMSRLSRMGASSCVQAVRDSKIDIPSVGPARVAVVAGTAHGSSASIETFYASFLQEGPRGAQPQYFPETVPNAPAGHIAMVLGITGPNTTFGQNDLSAENALLYAHRLLREQRVEAAVVCGLDELNPMLFGCYDDLRALNRGQKAPDGRWIPKMGAGIVLGEGAGALVLETAEHAAARGATIYAAFHGGVLLGAPALPGRYTGCRETLRNAIERTLEAAAWRPQAIDQISVSANFSGALEQVEVGALHDAMPERAGRLAVTPLRYLTGSFGGAGILGAAALARSIREGRPLPAIAAGALTGGDLPQWTLAPQSPARRALMTACTHGGGCAALAFGRAQGTTP
jgi:3-oxoacyl-[acyl-carrier-protein] synthase II